MGDVAIYAPETRRLLRSARNDKLLHHFLLRHGVPKDLARGQKTIQFFPPFVPPDNDRFKTTFRRNVSNE